jgi:hypothetical protein
MKRPETKMEVILVDSYNDRLILNGITAMDEEAKICLHDYFIPCANCGVAVLTQSIPIGDDCCIRCNECNHNMEPVTYIKSGIGKFVNYPDESSNILKFMTDCQAVDNTPCVDCNINDVCTKSINLPYSATNSAMLNMVLTQTLPEDIKMVKHPSEEMKIIASTTNVVVNRMLDMDKRITIATEAAAYAFWDVIAKSFPDSVDGAYLMENIEDILLPNVKHWVENNVPIKQSHSGHAIDDLNLHYEDTWHLCHTSGGCTVAVTDNVAIAGEYRYLAVSSDCVAACVDTFKENDFLNDYLFSWSFGDNPTVLMNYINDYLGTGYFDANKLFDDIITIGKSNKVS